MRSFIEHNLFDNSVPFDNTTPICLINLLWKSMVRIRIDLELHYFSIFKPAVTFPAVGRRVSPPLGQYQLTLLGN